MSTVMSMLATATPAETVATRPVVVLAGGGTGGHVVPALAMADAFTRVGSQVLFIGTAQGYEATMVPKRGYAIQLVPGSRLVGGGVGVKVRGLWALLQGIGACRKILRATRPSLVVGVGGYASGAALLAAATLGIPCAIHESNAVPGLTNRVLGRLVRRVYLGFAAARASFPPSRSVVTGNPVRREIAAVAAARAWPTDRPVHVLIVGGSQGSAFLNERVPPLLAALRDGGIALNVRHQVGKQDPAPVRQAYAAAAVEASVEGFIDDMAAAYAWADLAITRSGSGTVAELAAAALPALLVPFPHAAGDHQAANAEAFCCGGAGRWVRQADWQQPELVNWLLALFSSSASWQLASDAARAVALPDAASAVVRDSGETLGVAAWREVQP